MTAGPRLFGIELRFLDDRLLDTLDGWLAWGGVLLVTTRLKLSGDIR